MIHKSLIVSSILGAMIGTQAFAAPYSASEISRVGGITEDEVSNSVPMNVKKVPTDTNARVYGSNNASIPTYKGTVSNAARVYREIVTGSHPVPQSVTQKAQCVAIFPKVATAALVVGGSHGNGIAMCKSTAGKWSQPIFLDMNSGSIGAQAGGKYTDVVLFLMDDRAKQALRNGRFMLGSDVSVTAGTFDQSYNVPNTGVVAYTRTEGAFAGAALTGTNISRDGSEMKAFYGSETDLTEIFEGRTPQRPSQEVAELLSLLPNSQS